MNIITTQFLVVLAASAICRTGATTQGSPHMIGGQPWKHSTRPEVFDLNLYKGNKYIRTCKGSEIATQSKFLWITAAECLDTENYDQLQVKFNLHSKFDQIKFNLKGRFYHIHPEYNKTTGEHNIALITPLLHYVDKDSALRRIQLPPKGQNFEGKEADILLEYKTITEKDATKTYQVQTVQTKVIDSAYCEVWYQPSPTKVTVCVSGRDKGLQKEEIGIPLVVRENDQTFTLVGIATEIRLWANTYGIPIEFLDIGPYADWIQNF